MPAKKRAKRVIEVPDDEPADLRGSDVASGVPDAPDDVTLRDTRPSEDGGVEQHPVHDDDLEDLQPEDYEELIDEAAEGGFDPADKYEIERDARMRSKKPDTV